MITTAIVSFLAGLGLFFFGLQTLTDHLKALTNKRVRELIKKLTKTVVQGVFIGGLITMITQSMSALVFTLIGMMRAGAINVKQALPLVIGGNMLGGVILYIVAVDVNIGVLAVLGISAIVFTSSDSKQFKNYAGLFLGLALLFFGLNTMQVGVSPLVEMPWIQDVLKDSQGVYLLIFIISAIITIIVQSSLATIIIGLALSKAGLLTFEDATMIVYGANVGSSVLTFILSSKIKGQSKQVAMFQGYYNFVGAIMVVPIFAMEVYGGIPLFGDLVKSISGDLATQLALLNTLFNFVPGLLLVFFLPLIAKILGKYWPESIEEKLSSPKFLYDKVTEDTESALQLLYLEQARLVDLTHATFELLREENYNSKIAAYKEGFESLDKIITETINELSMDKRINSDQYESLNHLINTQSSLVILYNNIVGLSEELKTLKKTNEGLRFSNVAIEGLDAILLTLADVVKNKSNDDVEFLNKMTSEDGHGVESVRKAYLSQEREITPSDKKNLLSAMNRCERIVLSMGEVGRNFMKFSK